MKKVELLSPAGNMKCLKAAVLAGCDAVYLAGKLFGARAFAGNFTNDELIEAIKYCHLYGVKVYLTVNTLIYEREVNKFIEYIRFVHKNNIDAIIIQDLGMFDLIRKKFPNLEIHLSTQAHIHNLEGAFVAKKLGAKRIVIARETSLDVIKKIKKEVDIELECFIHGALCVSYSGQCLMSSLIGNRSGNRGTCSQCCRKKYDLYKDNKKINTDKYLLSMKDLCTINYLDKIIESGADSLKIEGRLKSSEYVYIVTKIYRKVIDNYYENKKVIIEESDIIDMKKMYNRLFTNGFILSEENENIVNQKRPNHIGIEVGNVIDYKNNILKIKLVNNVNVHDGLRILDEKEDKGLVINKMFVNNKSVLTAKKKDIISVKYDKYVKVNSKVLLTSDYNLIKKIDNEINTLKRKVLIDFEFVAHKNKNIILKVTDKINSVEIKSDFIINEAINKPTSKDIIEKQLRKTGSTIYEVNNVNISIDENIFINLKDINNLRRNILEKLNEQRLYQIPFIEKDYYIDLPDFKKEEKKTILVNNEKEKENNICYDTIYVKDVNLVSDKCILKLPRVNNNYIDYENKVLIGELGSLYKYKNFETDFSFNVTNSYTLAFLHSLGSKKVTLSVELNYIMVKDLIEGYIKRYNKRPNCEVIIYGNLESMICKFDLNKKYNIKEGYLVDEFNNKFKIESSLDYMTIYDYKKRKDNNDYYSIGVNSLRKNL